MSFWDVLQASGPGGMMATVATVGLASCAMSLAVRRVPLAKYEPLLWASSVPLLFGAIGVPVGSLKVEQQLGSVSTIDTATLTILVGRQEVYYSLFIGGAETIFVLLLALLGCGSAFLSRRR